MQNNNKWQLIIIFLSTLITAGILVGISALVGTSQNSVTPVASESQNQSEDSGSKTPEPAVVPVEDVKEGVTVTLATLLAVLEVREEENSETYDRAKFRHWINVDGKCSAREFVLISESTTEVKYSDEEECKVSTGTWMSLYDGATFKNARDLDIDHMVPLKEAWESGAESWNDNKRRTYANDTEYDKSLIAVSASSNRSKSDRDPADWMPEDETYTCLYIADWVSVKYRWNFTIDKTEKQALDGYVKDCDTTNVIVPPRG
jgi:hypothetical protein